MPPLLLEPRAQTCLYTSDAAREMTSSMPVHTASVSGSSPSPGVDSQTCAGGVGESGGVLVYIRG